MKQPLFIVVVLAVAGLLPASSIAQTQPLSAKTRSFAAYKMPADGAKRFVAKGGTTCVLQTMSCNSTVQGTISDTDCPLVLESGEEDGTFFDFWQFNGTNGQQVTANLTSSQFDTFLFLVNPDDDVVAADDDGGSGTNSRIDHQLDETGVWGLVPNNFFPGDEGDYTLTLTCGSGPPPPSGCVPNDTTLCLVNNRFRVELDWASRNNSGAAKVVPLGSDNSGLFYFSNPNNWEMLIKVLDNCNGNTNRFWVFAAATTTLEYELTVTDTQTGNVKQYFNPLGTSSPAITDTTAFSTCP